jgi:hypothetical protein
MHQLTDSVRESLHESVSGEDFYFRFIAAGIFGKLDYIPGNFRRGGAAADDGNFDLLLRNQGQDFFMGLI